MAFPSRPAPPEWVADCLQWRGEVLTGRYAHWCFEWDGLPIDETCEEWPCGCGIEAAIDASEDTGLESES